MQNTTKLSLKHTNKRKEKQVKRSVNLNQVNRQVQNDNVNLSLLYLTMLALLNCFHYNGKVLISFFDANMLTTQTHLYRFATIIVQTTGSFRSRTTCSLPVRSREDLSLVQTQNKSNSVTVSEGRIRSLHPTNHMLRHISYSNAIGLRFSHS